eukprot:4544660-Prorocentrum_lima.AAC.1
MNKLRELGKKDDLVLYYMFAKTFLLHRPDTDNNKLSTYTNVAQQRFRTNGVLRDTEFDTIPHRHPVME